MLHSGRAEEPSRFNTGITYTKGNDAPDFASVDSVNAQMV
jgi:hypothetical protein